MDDELLDRILDEVEALGKQLPAEQLAPLFEERARGLAPGTPGRAAWLSHAAERWEMQGDLERARSCYEQAAQDGGECHPDPRARLIGVLLDLGDGSRAEVIAEDLQRDLEAGWRGRYVHEVVGEALELHGRLEKALDWFTAGLVAADAKEQGAVDYGCLNGRWRVRRQLGLPVDRYDELCETHRRDYADVEDEKRLLRAPDGTTTLPRAVLFWPEPEFAQLLLRWPSLAEPYGTDHPEHKSRVERRLRALADHDGPLAVGMGSFEDYVRFVALRADQAEDASIRGMYVAHVTYAGRYVAWPPAADAPCWCGSGVAYAACCGAGSSPV